MSIEKRTRAGVVAGIAGFVVSLVLTLAVVPLLLQIWGAQRYGVWLALMAATTLLSTLDLGHQGFLGNEFNLTAAKGARRLRSTLASGLRIAALLGATQLVIAAVVVWTGKAGLFLGVGESLIEEQQLDSAFLLMVGVWCMFGSTSGLLVRLYPAQGLYARAQWLSLFQRLVLQFGVVIVVAMAGGGIWDFAVGYSVVGTVLAVFWFLEFRHRLSALYPWWTGGSWVRAWKNLRSSLLLTGNGILTQSVTNGTSVMIAILFDAAVVPAFTTVRTVANMFFQAAGVIVNPLVPDLVRFHVRSEWSKLIQTIQAVWFAGGLLNVGLLAIAPLTPWIFRVWTRGQLTLDLDLYYLLALAVCIRMSYTPLSFYLSGLNELRVQTTANAVQAVCALGLPLVLSNAHGLWVFGIGLVAAECCGFLIYAHRAGQHLRGFIGGNYSSLLMTFAALPVLVVMVTLALMKIFPDVRGIVASGGVIVSALLYRWQWAQLAESLKSRIIAVLPMSRLARRLGLVADEGGL